MQVTDLPLLHASATPEMALRAMRDAGRSAVVVDDGQNTSLIKGGAVAAAWKAKKPTLGDIAEHEPVSAITPAISAQFSLDVATPFSTEPQYRAFFNAVAPNYAHPALPGRGGPVRQGILPPAITVITASEGMLPALNMLGAYICNGPSRHTFPDPAVSSGQTCPLCPSSAHATVALVTV